MEWIGVEERLPEDRRHYLVACTWNEIRWVTKLLWDGYRFHVKQATSIVTHWQPLPELPEPAEPPKEPGPFKRRDRFVAGRDRQWVCYQGVEIWEVDSIGEAQVECDQLNKLWAQDKGSNDG